MIVQDVREQEFGVYFQIVADRIKDSKIVFTVSLFDLCDHFPDMMRQLWLDTRCVNIIRDPAVSLFISVHSITPPTP